MSMEKFALLVRENVILDCNLGRFRSELHVYEKVMGRTHTELLARWDQVHSEGDPERNARRRVTFVRLPRCAQAAVIAEWEGDHFGETSDDDLAWWPSAATERLIEAEPW